MNLVDWLFQVIQVRPNKDECGDEWFDLQSLGGGTDCHLPHLHILVFCK